ncbi:MAG: hypothetical protein ACQET5_04385 [Halobacteriota archaeon]
METKRKQARRTDTFGVHHLTVVPENFEPEAGGSDGADEGDRSAESDDR